MVEKELLMVRVEGEPGGVMSEVYGMIVVDGWVREV